MKIEIDWSCSDELTKVVLNNALESDGVFKGTLKKFLNLMTILKHELEE